MNKNAVRLKDIAERLNVSINTVSRALKDAKDISIELKTKIKKLANEMGYVPNNLSDYIRGGSTNLFGVVINKNSSLNINNELINYLKIIQDEGYAPILLFEDNDKFTYETLFKLISNRVCKILSFLNPETKTNSYIKKNKVIYLNALKSNEDSIKEFIKNK